jgi:hypothetical protein
VSELSSFAKMPMSNSEKVMFRGQVSSEVNRLVRTLAALKEANISDVLSEALEDWLAKPENQELIKKHNLR